jgi:hypothetical protein
MDKHTIELLARRAGLDKPPAEFPEDVPSRRGESMAKLKPPSDP